MTTLINFTPGKAEEFQLDTFIYEDDLERILFEEGWEALKAKVVAKYTPNVAAAIVDGLECLHGVPEETRPLMREFVNEFGSPDSFSPAYSPDCPACLRHLPHSLEEHEAALRRNYEASLPDYPDSYLD
jgi:hypothetical protein